MARKSALPEGSLDRLIDEVTAPAPPAKRGKDAVGAARRGTPRSAAFRSRSTKPRAAPARSRSPFSVNADDVVRYAASRGVVIEGGPLEKLRLAWQYAIDVREVARKEQVSSLTVLSRALAAYLVLHG
jgi:hypothetical protein